MLLTFSEKRHWLTAMKLSSNMAMAIKTNFFRQNNFLLSVCEGRGGRCTSLTEKIHYVVFDSVPLPLS